MKFLKPLLSILITASFFPSAIYCGVEDQDGSSYDDELNEADFKALRNFVKTKRDIPLKEKATKMTISGDVRAEWRHMSETGRKGLPTGEQHQLRGSNAVDYGGYPISRNDLDAEFNLYFDYKTDRTWAVAQLQFDNSTGVFDNNKSCPREQEDSAQELRDILFNGKDTPDPEGWHGSGKCDKICLKKAYFGYNLYHQCDRRVDIEIGRRRLSNVFDSDVQYLCQFDGITLKMSDKAEWASSAYLNVAGFVINERINHFGYIAETGLLDIQDTGIDVKYSFIDWRKHGRAQCFKGKGVNKSPDYKNPEKWFRNPDAFRFAISQVLVYYNLNPDYFCGKPAGLYGAFVLNHAQRNFKYIKSMKEIEVNGKKKFVVAEEGKARNVNQAWYIGFEIGEVKKENDWAIDIEYMYVGALAVPDGDSKGIARCNVYDESLTSVDRGNTNFKGWRFEFLYAITDNLTLNSILEWSKAANPKIGGHHTYRKFELETIYAF